MAKTSFSLTKAASQTLDYFRVIPKLNSEDLVWKKDLETKKLFSCKVATLAENGWKNLL